MDSAATGCKVSSDQIPIVSFKIIGADFFEYSSNGWWIVNLEVGNGLSDVTGWAFVGDELTELRFEHFPTGDPPAMLTGYKIAVPYENNALTTLIEQSCHGKVEYLENLIKGYLNRCMFCVRSLACVGSVESVSKAIAYRYAKKIIPISKA
jgi:hypothetical protein